jgi:hypothetical protein
MEEINLSLKEGTIDPLVAKSELKSLEQQKVKIYDQQRNTTTTCIKKTIEHQRQDVPANPLQPSVNTTTTILIPHSPVVIEEIPTVSNNIPNLTQLSSPEQSQIQTEFINSSIDSLLKLNFTRTEQMMFNSSIIAGLLPFYKSSKITLLPPSPPLEHRFTPRMFFSSEEVKPPIGTSMSVIRPFSSLVDEKSSLPNRLIFPLPLSQQFSSSSSSMTSDESSSPDSLNMKRKIRAFNSDPQLIKKLKFCGLEWKK